MVVTSSEDLSNIVGRKKESLVSANFKKKSRDLGLNLSIGSLYKASLEDVMNYFIDHANDTAGGIVILDEEYRQDFSKLSPGLFLSYLSITSHKPNYQNILSAAYSNSLRSFLPLYERFIQGQYQKILMLPEENFFAPEKNTFFHSMLKGDTKRSCVEDIDIYLRDMRKRQNPKRSSTYNTTYYVDDQDNYFEMGLERHARPETRCPPHSIRCELNSKYRFGNKLDDSKHFNVTSEKEKEYISGVFTNCHGDRELLPSRTHINMFPNDYYS